MKKLLYTAAIGLILVTGCKKSALNLYPYNQVATEQAFTTQQLVQFDINGMYQGLRASGSYFVGTWNIVPDVLADNLVLDQQGRQSLKSPYYNYTYNSNSTYGLFSGGYTIIRRANAILENIGQLPASTFRNDATGQALALRAMVYFDMSRVYSKTYLNATASDYTLPYVITSAATNLPGSEPLQGFYDKVIADLVAAEPLINPIATNKNIFLNREAVAGLLSRVYLYKGDYANCILEANKALGNATGPALSAILPTTASFNAIWLDADNANGSGGVLFKVKNTSLDNLNTPGVNYYQFTSRSTPTSTGNGYKSEYLPDYTFYGMFAANDVRKSSYFQTNYFNGTLYNHIIKYAGRNGPPELGIGIPNPSANQISPAGVVDGKALRTAEVLLNRMEAKYRTNDIAGAVADLVLLKTARYTGYDATADNLLTGAALLTEILKQRRLELAFEGDRFFDLKRLNLPVVRDAVHGEKADGTGTPPAVAGLAAGDFKFQLPYPQTEITVNPAIKQNPNY